MSFFNFGHKSPEQAPAAPVAAAPINTETTPAPEGTPTTEAFQVPPAPVAEAPVEQQPVPEAKVTEAMGDAANMLAEVKEAEASNTLDEVPATPTAGDQEIVDGLNLPEVSTPEAPVEQPVSAPTVSGVEAIDAAAPAVEGLEATPVVTTPAPIESLQDQAPSAPQPEEITPPATEAPIETQQQ